MYDDVILWFGKDDFCLNNIKCILNTLKEYEFNGRVVINIVDELSGDIEEIKSNSDFDSR